ncbi:hypothetical protein [Erwinia amylovora]
MTAVSYTHLDVYKRQRQCAAFVSGVVKDAFSPVSYTHLDVYKRQLKRHFIYFGVTTYGNFYTF